MYQALAGAGASSRLYPLFSNRVYQVQRLVHLVF
jgi:hypothetical protein